MAIRTRLFPALALLLAVASIIALSVALPGPAGAIVIDPSGTSPGSYRSSAER